MAVFDYRGGEVEAVLDWKSPAAFTRPMDRFTVGEAPPLALAVGFETVFNGFNLERDRESAFSKVVTDYVTIFILPASMSRCSPIVVGRSSTTVAKKNRVTLNCFFSIAIKF